VTGAKRGSHCVISRKQDGSQGLVCAKLKMRDAMVLLVNYRCYSTISLSRLVPSPHVKSNRYARFHHGAARRAALHSLRLSAVSHTFRPVSRSISLARNGRPRWMRVNISPSKCARRRLLSRCKRRARRRGPQVRPSTPERRSPRWAFRPQARPRRRTGR
jgi:hypothetical protein